MKNTSSPSVSSHSSKPIKIGVLLRVFNKKEEDLPKTLELVSASLTALAEASKTTPITHVRIAVPVNTFFKDHDCGVTVKAITDLIATMKLPSFYEVIPSQEGLFCGIPNEAAADFWKEGITHMAIISPGVHQYIAHNLQAMSVLAGRGKLAIGLILPELREATEAGAVSNTFALYELGALLVAGGFSWLAENPAATIESSRVIVHEGKTIAHVGMEEMHVLAYLLKRWQRTGQAAHAADGLSVPRPIAVVEPMETFVWHSHRNKAEEAAKHSSKMARLSGWSGLYLHDPLLSLLKAAVSRHTTKELLG